MRKSRNLPSTIMFIIMMALSMLSLSFGVIWFIGEMHHHTSELEALRENEMNTQRAILKSKVDYLARRLSYVGTGVEDREAYARETGLFARLDKVRDEGGGHIMIADAAGRVLVPMAGLSGSKTGEVFFDTIVNREFLQAVAAIDSTSFFREIPGDAEHGQAAHMFLTYAVRQPNWNWLIIGDVDICDTEARLEALARENRQAITLSSFYLMTVIAVVFMLSMGVAKVFVNRLHREMSVFDRFFNEGGEELHELDPEQLTLDEFRKLAQAANTMIEARRDAEEKMAEIQERFQLAIDGTRDGLFDWDCASDRVYLSPRLNEMLGRTDEPAQLDFGEWNSWIHAADRENARRTWENLLHSDALHFELTYRVPHRDGRILWMMNRGIIVRDDSGRAARVVGFRTDITQQKQMQVALDEANTMLFRERNLLSDEKERLAVTLRSIGDAVIALDVEGRIQMMNEAAESLAEQQQRELVGRRFSKFFQLVDRKNPEAGAHRILENILENAESVSTSDMALVLESGREKHVSLTGSPILSRFGKIFGVVLVIRDITEKLRMEDEIIKAQKLESVGVLAGGIAHDFNNLLMAILGNVSLAREDLESGLDVRDMLADAEAVTLRARDLTTQLLTFSKGGAPVRRLQSVVEPLIETARFSLRGSDSRLEFTVVEDLWSAEVDIGQITQVVNNLVINADQAMPDGGVITIRMSNLEIDNGNPYDLEPGCYVSLSVSDEGCGIPDAVRDRIFDPYFTTKNSGSGLGLASAFSIIRKHHGHIHVQSVPGAGSTFTLLLPAVASAAVERSGGPTAQGTSVPQPKHVLLMDDDEMVLSVCSQMLGRLGCRTDLARDGLEAIRSYDQAVSDGDPFDLVMVDLTVPGGMGGVETLQVLAGKYPDVQVVASSGYSTDPVISRYGDLGFAGAISKPYSIDDLKKVLLEIG